MGMLIAVRNSLAYSAQSWGSTSSSLWVKLEFLGGQCPPLFIAGVYLPPEGSPRLQDTPLPHRITELEGRIHEALLSGSVVLAGDFNARLSVASTSSSLHPPAPLGMNTHGRRLVELATATSLSICTGLVEGDFHAPPSFPISSGGGTRPDHVLVSPSGVSYITSIRVQDDLRGSDHYPIHVHVHLPLAQSAPTPSPLPMLRRLLWRGSCRLLYVNALEGEESSLIQCQSLAQSGNIPQALSLFQATLFKAATQAGMLLLPQGRSRPSPRHKPFFDKECLELKRAWKKLGRQVGWHDAGVRTLERRYHALVRSKKRSWLLQQLQGIIAMYHSEPRRFWRILHGSSPRLPDPLSHPSAWSSFALGLQSVPISVHSILSEVAFPHQAPSSSTQLEIPFTLVEVESAILSMKSGRVPGLSGYPSEFLRFAQKPWSREAGAQPHLMVPPLTAILNAMLTSGVIPADNNILTVTPVLKDPSGSLLDTSNYRPIAVQEPLIRLYASLLNNRLVKYLEDNKLRCQAQCGFRPGFSTLHALFALQHFIDMASASAPLYVCFLDLSKAYDRVPRKYLWEALRRLGIGEGFVRAVRSTFDGVRFTVLAGGSGGPFHASVEGVTQGSPISPTLFTIYADGLLRYLRATCPEIGPKTREGIHVPDEMYADDLTLLASNAQDLQSLIDAVGDWCDASHMSINPPKSNIMVFPSSPTAPPSFQWTCQGAPLKVVFSKKYLGVMLSSIGGVGGTFDLLHGKMWATWSSLLRQYGNLQCAGSIGLLLKLVLACIVPTASYACEIWGWRTFPSSPSHSSAQKLESDYLVMLRMLLGVRPSVATPILLAELGVQPISHHWLKRMATFWNSLVALPPDHMYSSILRDSCYYGVTSHTPTWAGCFMKALIQIGYPYHIDCLQPHEIDIKALKHILRRHHRQCWRGLHLSPRQCPSVGAQLCAYSRWFASPSRTALSRLLFLRMSISKLRTFHRFRMGVHNLPIDSGRRRGIPRSERLCDMCDTGLIGDEHHMVFSCPAFQSIRDRYPHLFCAPSRSLKTFIWQSDLASVVNFVFDCFQARH
jgi:hypothetical protein